MSFITQSERTFWNQIGSSTHDVELTATGNEKENNPKTDLHSLRARDAKLNDLANIIQQEAVQAVTASLSDSEIQCLKSYGTILVTGSAGYLGAALVMLLKSARIDVQVVGIDAVKNALDVMVPTVDHCIDVADYKRLSDVATSCSAVFHTAALHRPNATHHHVSEFYSTNVVGTDNILRLGLPTVHTSTTSLTVTPGVQYRIASGEVTWLDGSPSNLIGAPTDAENLPRNKYGRTKLLAEKLCARAVDEKQMDCVVLRASRFFPEDKLEISSLSMPNIKANELLGRRVSLVDLLRAHISALINIKAVRGVVLTLVAPWPWAWRHPTGDAKSLAAFVAKEISDAASLYAKIGWKMPEMISRVYDHRNAVELLNWKPCITWDSLLEVLRQEQTNNGIDNNQDTNGNLENTIIPTDLANLPLNYKNILEGIF